MGEVTGAHSFLKMVIMATMKPPMRPPIITPLTAEASPADCRKRRQVQAAVAIEQSSRMPVLFTVPLRVMRPAAAASPNWPAWARSVKVLSPRAGFEVLISAINIFSALAWMIPRGARARLWMAAARLGPWGWWQAQDDGGFGVEATGGSAEFDADGGGVGVDEGDLAGSHEYLGVVFTFAGPGERDGGSLVGIGHAGDPAEAGQGGRRSGQLVPVLQEDAVGRRLCILLQQHVAGVVDEDLYAGLLHVVAVDGGERVAQIDALAIVDQQRQRRDEQQGENRFHGGLAAIVEWYSPRGCESI